MDKKWAFAARHSWASLSGFVRLFHTHPAFAVTLFARRLRYFLRRKFDTPLLTPAGFLIETADALIAYWSMFVERELHDPRWVRAVTRGNKPLVVDVGANAGVFSHYVHCLNGNCEFVAFEPLASMVEQMRRLKDRTGINLTVHQKAVARTCGEALFESEHGYDGTSHLAAGRSSGTNTFRVETTTLDTVLGHRKITLMKVDVEGFELDVIEGGMRALAQTDFVIMEAEDPVHLANVTRALGKGWTRKRLGATDYLFARTGN